MNVHLMVITDGREDCFARTVGSIPMSFWREISTATVVDDSGSLTYFDWLRSEFPDLQHVTADHKLGFGGAVQLGWETLPSETTHVFHLEDDFQLHRNWELQQMLQTLDAASHLAQLVLKRQPWNKEEKTAGGIVECWPDLYTEVETPHGWYTQHRLFFSTNPCIYRRELTLQGWPSGGNSERQFTDQLLSDPELHFAFLGRKFDPPCVHHIGETRVGVGY